MDLKALRKLNKDDILSGVGLQTRPSTAASIAGSLVTFSVGMLVGAGLGLLLAPKSGPALREDIRERLRRSPEDLKQALSSVKSKIQRDNSSPTA